MTESNSHASTRHELLALLNTALQLVGLMLDDAASEVAPKSISDDLHQVKEAGRKLVHRIDSLSVEGPKDLHHYLMTPLTHFIGYCELLAEEETEPWASRFQSDVEQLLTAGRQMQQQIQHLLTASPSATIGEIHHDSTRRSDTITGRILVVDDEELNRHLLQRWLIRQGHEVTFGANGREALDLIHQHSFDLILLDVLMPELNGFEVLLRIKSEPNTRDLPVIMISALTELDSVVRCIENGAEDYLPKPFQPVLLNARINACLEKKRLRDREMEFVKKIDQERERYNELLHVMLPAEIVQELKKTQVVTPRRYESVAVLFADIAGFTRFCDGHPPEEVVPLLQSLVSEFELITEHHGVQKIKTIGDSFMAVAGLLRKVENPVRACVECAIEMLHVAHEIPPHWFLRVGIHYGSVVAGLLGTRYDLFDLWGDTVNTASRVEHSGLDGAITLSETAWEQIAGIAEGEPLGLVEIKGKARIGMVRFGKFS